MASETEHNLDDFPIRGDIDFGGVHLTWDLSDLERKYRAQNKPIIDRRGRILMPELNIF